MTPEHLSKIEAVAGFFNLAPDPKHEQSQWQKVFLLPDGGTLHFSESRNGHKHFHIGVWPRHDLDQHKPSYYKEEPPTLSINVSADKTAEEISRDIKRRIMGDYKAHVARCEANKAQTDQRRDAELVAINSIAAKFGMAMQCDEHHPYEIPLLQVYRQGLHLQAQIWCNGEIKLTLDVTQETAGKVAELLASLCPPEPQNYDN